MGGLRKILIFIIFFVILTIFTGAVSSVEFTTDEVANASGNITSYVQTNHALPSSVNISGSQVNMAQYLHLSTQAVLKINNGSSSSIILQNPANPNNPSENIEPGNIPLAQYITMAGTVNGYMQSNQKAPNYSSNSGLGTQFSYQNLIYTYNKILNSYKVNRLLPASIEVDLWKGVYNNRTNTSYVHIQDAINDAFTVNGNTIFIDMGIYKENILVNKTLDIVAQNGKNVIIQASNSSKPVFKIISTGSGSTIQGFTIKGATDSCGI